MSTTTNSIVFGGYTILKIDEASTLATVQVHAPQFSAHWQQMKDGSHIVAFNIGEVSIHLSPEDAEKIGYTLAQLGCEAQDAHEAAEVLAA